MKSRFKTFTLLMLTLASPLLAVEGSSQRPALQAVPVPESGRSQAAPQRDAGRPQVVPGRDAMRNRDRGHAVVGNRMERVERVDCRRARRPCYPRRECVVVAGRWDPVLYEPVRYVRRPIVREVVVVDECPCCYNPIYEECDSCECGFEFSFRASNRRCR
ncbi:hypothetical protein [Estrella lausannensis]|uniref:Putative secreted protein n=1 Tax=Estrella lausannensis TaxID=483423 RepID=A0A0H5DP50_9BACT|nr:hypothetical protein [Estrella lausannensis]CRX38132.1 putative secreted protein [Estrella lausannensis]